MLPALRLAKSTGAPAAAFLISLIFSIGYIGAVINLIPDPILVALQMGIFLLALFGLNFLVFRPVLRLIDKRKTLTEGYRAEAEALGAKTESLMEQVEAKMKSAREEGLEAKGELTKAGEEEAGKILAASRQEVEGSLEKHRQELQAESKEAQLALKKYTRELSEEMAGKLLGRKVSA